MKFNTSQHNKFIHKLKSQALTTTLHLQLTSSLSTERIFGRSINLTINKLLKSYLTSNQTKTNDKIFGLIKSVNLITKQNRKKKKEGISGASLDVYGCQFVCLIPFHLDSKENNVFINNSSIFHKFNSTNKKHRSSTNSFNLFSI